MSVLKTASLCIRSTAYRDPKDRIQLPIISEGHDITVGLSSYHSNEKGFIKKDVIKEKSSEVNW